MIADQGCREDYIIRRGTHMTERGLGSICACLAGAAVSYATNCHFAPRQQVVTMERLILGLCAIGGILIVVWFQPVRAETAERCPQAIAEVVSTQGTIELREARSDVWRPAGLFGRLCPGDSIHVGGRSRAAIVLLDSGAVLRIDQNTTLRILGPPGEGPSVLDLILGAIEFLSRVPRSLEVRTPFVNAGIKGTEFVIRVEADRTLITVLEGQVAATSEAGRLTLTSGQSAVTSAGRPPELRDLVRPRDAVRWALYYRPILPLLIESVGMDGDRDLSPALRKAIDAWKRGDLSLAFARLDRMAQEQRDVWFHLYRAGLLLAVGQVDEALTDLDNVSDSSAAAGDKFALLAVVAVAGNKTEEALSQGRSAVELSPTSLAARIAFSYALQANFELEAARDTLLETVKAQPNNALAWARIAELWLSLGYPDKALEAAERAAALFPDLGRTNLVLGFAALAEIKLSEAKAAFEKAIAFDSAEPLARLGLGLTKIRGGDLGAGRRDIEIAAALDPNNALVRSYLGKAYFEEKRRPLDAEQFDLAKQLDPTDPTPWFYDAIRKQTENRPVKALEDLQRSIELNDNRAVYRSRLLLDEDLATRGIGLARIYDNLGFNQLALVESAKSLSLDPASHSAHRFLSDSYVGQPRHEIARVSDLLQAQLLQPVNIDPVQPSLLETDLNILEGLGPDRLGVNEFTTVFNRNRLRLDATGVAGNNDTYGDEAVLSGVYGRFSGSVGQFHYESDGFRDNNDLEHNIYNAFAQVALTDELDIQAEYRRRETDQGDITLNFDPNDFSRDDRRDITQDTARVGFHLAPRPQWDILGSLIYSDRDEGLFQTFPDGASLDVESKRDGYDAQGQAIYKTGRFNLIAGLGVSEIDADTLETLNISGTFPGGICPPGFPANCNFESTRKSDLDQLNAYLYSSIDLPAGLNLTLGLSYDEFDKDNLDLDEINHKLGLRWSVTDYLSIRLAWFEILKRELLVEQTLEPTQIAAFNQFFDDFNGSRSERYGAGIDLKLTDSLYGGVEASRRDVKVPVTVIENGETSTEFDDQDEDLLRGYLYWALHPSWALSIEPRYERINLDSVDPAVPEEIETISIPLSLRYFHSSGLFAEIGATYVRQEIDLPPSSTFGKDSDDFVVVNALIGYRLPRRSGLVSLEVRNLLDEDFRFQDLDGVTSEDVNPRYIPDMTILGRITLNF